LTGETEREGCSARLLAGTSADLHAATDADEAVRTGPNIHPKARDKPR